MTYKEKILKPCMDACGYLHYRLTKEPNKYVLIKAHRLVAKHFLKDYSQELTVNHINFDKKDNRVENLQMLTRAENVHDYYNNFTERRTIKCIETGQEFRSFKSWCKRNGIHFSKYYFRRSLQEHTKYHGTDYSFQIVLKENKDEE